MSARVHAIWVVVADYRVSSIHRITSPVCWRLTAAEGHAVAEALAAEAKANQFDVFYFVYEVGEDIIDLFGRALSQSNAQVTS